jgi:superfamily II DNA or RNA helicase
MALTSSGFDALKLVLKNLVEEHPLFWLKYCGYEGYVHQAELFYKLALRQPIRTLIADEIGLGKTIEALSLISWGLRKGKFPNKRVLILVPRSLIGQWEKEARRMELSPMTEIRRLESAPLLPERTVFIFKIDTAKRDEHKEKLLKYKWDVIVVDEAHKLGLDTKRLKLVEELISKNPEASVLFLSATPHRGDDEQYLKLLSLLGGINKDVARRLGSEFYGRVMDALVFRRSKKEVNEIYEKERIFVDAELVTRSVEPTEDEREYIEKLDELTRALIRESPDERLRQAIGLLAIIIDKRGLSSPHAGWLTFERILSTIGVSSALKPMAGPLLEERQLGDLEEDLEDYMEEEYVSGKDPDVVVEGLLRERTKREEIRSILKKHAEDISYLLRLAQKVQESDSKLAELQKILSDHLERGEKVIVFTEFADTADYLFEKLDKTLPCEMRKISGRDFKVDKTTIEEVKEWLSGQGPRVLISTDVASEGLNLQYANVLINYELPWSLVKLEQRTGRVWRLGQRKNVKIYLIILNHSFESIIFESLYRKLAESVKARIVPSTLLALKSADGLELPVSGIVEEYSLYNLWFRYKTGGREGIASFVREYLEKLKKFGEMLKKVGLYHEKKLDPPLIRETIEARLRKTIGFTNKRELDEALTMVVRKIMERAPTESEYEHFVRRILREAIKHPVALEGLHVYCGDVDEPTILLRARVNVGGGDGICWLYAYRIGRDVKVAKRLADFFKVMSDCEEIGKALADEVLRRYNGLVEKVKVDALNYVRGEVLNSLLEDYFKYLEYAKKRNLRGGLIIKPVTMNDIEVRLDPLMLVVPKGVVEGLLKDVEEDIVKEIEELILIGEITDEKLEIEGRGREVLEKVLGDDYELLYIGDTKAPFDYIVRRRGARETAFAELKTLRRQRFVIYTESEKEFAERVSGKCDYWLYVVDLLNREVRGYHNPLMTGKLRLVKGGAFLVRGKEYFVYEERGEPDLSYSF